LALKVKIYYDVWIRCKSRSPSQTCKYRIALALAFPQDPPMLARVLSDALNGIEAFPVEVEVNCGWGDTVIVLIMSISPISNLIFVLPQKPPALLTPVRLVSGD
jgi:hypothetical protein